MANSNDRHIVDPGRLRQAEQFCKQRLRNDPENRTVLHLLAEVYRKAGNLAAAAGIDERLCRLKPADQEAGDNQMVFGGWDRLPIPHIHRASPSFEVNSGTADQEKTIVVLGAYRGGTSMVAGILKALGVFMGEKFSAHPEYDNLEDLEFQRFLHVPKVVDEKIRLPTEFSAADFPLPDGVKALIERRNQDHRLWGWKYPGTVLWLLHSRLADYLRNPHFVTVFRDPLAICQHELDVRRVRPESFRAADQISFRWVSSQLSWLSDHVMRCEYPHLLISYERLVRSSEPVKAALVDSLIRFLGPALPESRRDSAIKAIGQQTLHHQGGVR